MKIIYNYKIEDKLINISFYYEETIKWMKFKTDTYEFQIGLIKENLFQYMEDNIRLYTRDTDTYIVPNINYKNYEFIEDIVRRYLDWEHIDIDTNYIEIFISYDGDLSFNEIDEDWEYFNSVNLMPEDKNDYTEEEIKSKVDYIYNELN